MSNKNPLRLTTMVAYASPAFALAIMTGPASSILQGIYTQHFGLTLEAIAGYIILARLFDAITDPLIGIFSDKTRHWFGGRKLWVSVGAFVSVIAIRFLFVPPEDVSPEYFFVFFVLAYLGWTMVEIPHLAWGNELTRDYERRSKIFGLRTALVFGGVWLFVSMPLLPIFNSSEFNGETLEAAFWVVAILLPISTVCALVFCPQGQGQGQGQEQEIARDTIGLRRLFLMVVANKPFLLLCAVIALISLATGMQSAIAYIHLTSYLQLHSEAAIIYATGFPLALLGIPIWLHVIKKFSKDRAYATGVGLTSLSFLLLGLLDPSDTIWFGFPITFWQYAAIFALLQLLLGSLEAIPPAILGDTADYGHLKTGQDNSGTYFAVYQTMRKMVGGLAGGVGLFIAARYGFDPAASTQIESAGTGVKLVMAYIPAVLGGIATLIILTFPITRHRHAVIVKRIRRLRSRTQP